MATSDPIRIDNAFFIANFFPDSGAASVLSGFSDIENSEDTGSIYQNLVDLLDVLNRKYQIKEVAYFCRHEESGYPSKRLQRLILRAHEQSKLSGPPKFFADYASEDIEPIHGVEITDIRWWLLHCDEVYRDTHVDWKQHHTLVYLPGKPQKVERSLVLLELLKSSVSKHLVYSFRPQLIYDSEHVGFMPDCKDFCISVSSEFFRYTGIGWIAWSKSVQTEIDQSPADGLTEWLARGDEAESVINHRARVVCETWAYSPKFITEKCFAPMVLGIPFFTWDTGNSEFLESLGFKSFDRLVDPDLPLHEDHLKRARELARRIEKFWKFSENPDFQEQVDKIIEHNLNQIATYRHDLRNSDKFFLPIIKSFENSRRQN